MDPGGVLTRNGQKIQEYMVQSNKRARSDDGKFYIHFHFFESM